ncbi:hypothetical protein [Pseudomonas oryzihabitans]|uniref:hypothetical protein n=1 Tax=Pseudomonas oryzihabitans TaxID=47885 RepID=UPI00214E71F9|nr:hypothetical protein [Pseudomonas psychrotolerans]UUW74188.1 hypothetical protein NRG74_22850 [Pseudomonas psychrotolerans]
MSETQQRTQQVPDVKSQEFRLFCEFLRKSDCVPPRGVERKNYIFDLEVINVPVDISGGYSLGKCWYNCLDQVIKHGGEVIYGWALWSIKGGCYVAQHHAVWRNEDNELFDVTPNEIRADTILFMPDGRALFDVCRLFAPKNLEWDDSKSYRWVGNSVRPEKFGYRCLSASPNEAVDIARIQQKALGLKDSGGKVVKHNSNKVDFDSEHRMFFLIEITIKDSSEEDSLHSFTILEDERWQDLEDVNIKLDDYLKDVKRSKNKIEVYILALEKCLILVLHTTGGKKILNFTIQ